MSKSKKFENRIYKEDGFSIVEILVAITITTILIGFASGIYLWGQRYFLNWQRGLSLQNEVHTLANGISEDLFRAEGIIELKDQLLVLEGKDEKEKHYIVKNDTLLKEDVALIKPSLSLLSFEITAKEREKNLSNSNDTRKIEQTTLIEFSLTLSDGKDSLATKRRIYLRKPSNWKTLNNN